VRVSLPRDVSCAAVPSPGADLSRGPSSRGSRRGRGRVVALRAARRNSASDRTGLGLLVEAAAVRTGVQRARSTAGTVRSRVAGWDAVARRVVRGAVGPVPAAALGTPGLRDDQGVARHPDAQEGRFAVLVRPRQRHPSVEQRVAAAASQPTTDLGEPASVGERAPQRRAASGEPARAFERLRRWASGVAAGRCFPALPRRVQEGLPGERSLLARSSRPLRAVPMRPLRGATPNVAPSR